MQVKLGETLPLFVVLEDETTDKIVKADVIDPALGTVLHSAVTLTYVPSSAGHYRNASLTMPNRQNLQVIYSVFEADGETLIQKGEETVSLKELSGGGASDISVPADLIATIEEDPITGIVSLHLEE